MPESPAGAIEEQLTLCSRLADLARVWPWTEAIVRVHAVPPSVEFAIDLCLEEALSNVIRHGLGGDCSHSVTVRYAIRPAESRRELFFVIEDDAPHFDPLSAPSKPEPELHSPEDLAEGGRGIQLLRKFARSLQYEAMPVGNRLTIGFWLS